MIAEPRFRCPTGSAIDRLAKRFDLPTTDRFPQDWEHCVADPRRLREFLSAYETLSLDEDERFCLLEIILQSFEDSDGEVGSSPDWQRIEQILKDNFELHAYTIWYWANFDATLEDSWGVSQPMRKLFQEQKARRPSTPTSKHR